MANPYLLPANASIAVPTGFGVFGYAQGGFTGYRWLFVTAIVNNQEYGNFSNIGDIHGDTAPNSGGLAVWTKPAVTPDKYRVYCFNCRTAAGALFQPQANPTPAGLIANDGGAPICRFKEIPASPDNHGPWPPGTEQFTHEVLFLSDNDGTDYWGGAPSAGPTGTLVASPATLPLGGGVVTVTWTSANASHATLYDSASGVAVDVDLAGARPYTINAGTTWVLTLTGDGGSVQISASTTVTGAAPPPAPAPPTTPGVVQAIQVYCRSLASAGATTERIHIGDETTDVTVPATDTDPNVPIAIRWGILDAEAFDALEFGMERLTAGGTVSLFACCAEVLHGTSTLPPPAWAGAGHGYRHKIVTWVGNGDYLDVAGAGFPPRGLIWKKVDGTGATGSGGIALGRLGGTRSRSIDGTTLVDAVQGFTADGFVLGPSAYANENGVTYVGYLFQDGQANGDGPWLTEGVYYQSATAPRTVALEHLRADVTDWTPDFLLVQGAAAMVLRHTGMVGNESISLGPVTTATDYITAVGNRAFTVGNQANNLNGVSPDDRPMCYVALKQLPSADSEDLAQVFDWDVFIGTGSILTVTGLQFAPGLVVADHMSGGYTGRFRERASFSGSNSAEWTDADLQTDGITALTNDGFTAAAALSPLGVSVFWFAAADTAALDGTEPPGGGGGQPVPPPIVPDGTICAGGGLHTAAGTPDGTPGCTDC